MKRLSRFSTSSIFDPQEAEIFRVYFIHLRDKIDLVENILNIIRIDIKSLLELSCTVP
jgi:hypothetical protein